MFLVYSFSFISVVSLKLADSILLLTKYILLQSVFMKFFTTDLLASINLNIFCVCLV